jgi:uncharacterized protein
MVDVTVPVIDVDSHVTEVVDLWTSRISRKWGDAVPHVWHDEDSDLDRWIVGGTPLTPVGYFSATNFEYPDYPGSLDVADPGSYDAKARLLRLDEYGIQAQVLYPNIIGFNSIAFAKLEPELSVACVEAYNDYMADFASADPARLAPIMMLPFWDVEASCREIERAAALGLKGILFAAHWERMGLPPVGDPHWDPVLAAAEATGLSLNTHIGFQSGDVAFRPDPDRDRMPQVTGSVSILMSNVTAVAKFIGSGICHRYPNLKIVSVESGFNYLPWVLDCLDWHFKNFNITRQYPDYLLPSEYFKRQIYATFWFEGLNVESITEYQDNVMFETDYPHPTSLTANNVSTRPVDFIEHGLAKLPDGIVRKLLHDNAAHVYKLP